MKTTLLINCPDQAGIIFAITKFVHAKGGNIVYLDQHVDQQANIFFMRLESDFKQSAFSILDFKKEFEIVLAKPYDMKFSIYDDTTLPSMAVFVSKYNHCLYDLLSRHHSGELGVKIPFISSNHLDLKPIAEQFGIPYFHIPVSKETKQKAEAKQLELLQKFNVDFIVLA